MVTRQQPTPVRSSPPATDIDMEWDDVQRDAQPLDSAAVESLTKIHAKDTARQNNQTDENTHNIRKWLGLDSLPHTRQEWWDATMEFSEKTRDKMTVAEMMRQVSKGLSIKFIAVIGLTGTGKSSLIKEITGKDVHIEHSINAGTTSFEMFPAIIDDQRYVFVDTPGFNDRDPERTDIHVYQEILKWFETMSPYCNIAGVLYVHAIATGRFSKSEDLNLKMLKALCGEYFFPNVTIVTTMWQNYTESAKKRAERKEKELAEGPWKELLDGGARIFSHHHGVSEPEEEDYPEDVGELEAFEKELAEKHETAREALYEMMSYYKTSKNISPHIQKELRKRVGILDTAAGTVLRRSMNLPPTPANVDSEGNSPAMTPSITSDRSEFLQPTEMHFTQKHRVVTPASSVTAREGPFPEYVPDGYHSDDGTEETEDPQDVGPRDSLLRSIPRNNHRRQLPHTGEPKNEKPKTEGQQQGWWQNLVRAIRWFFFRR
ncbi:P-loop containing nucleoside triphosphate hydrolase protein [Pyronema omphalodes]|nr:P-loop containing nucleoside triphosphate hydrolase protein [Pyronema omphalodes]